MNIDKSNWRNDVKDFLYNTNVNNYTRKNSFVFNLKNSNSDILKIETERPDLIYGVSFIILPECEKTKYENAIAINPYSKEEIPLFFENTSTPRLGIPAHNDEDYDFAIKNNLPIKQVIMPVNTSINDSAPRDDKEWTQRETVILVVKHWEEEKYLYIAYNEHDWKCLITGGIEGNESYEETAIRELEEESGYCDIKSIHVLPFKLANVFYAAHKGVNRYVTSYGYYIELASGMQKSIAEEELKEHTIHWENKDNLFKILENGFTDCIWLIKQALGEVKAYTGNGKYINSDLLNDLESREEAIEKMIAE